MGQCLFVLPNRHIYVGNITVHGSKDVTAGRWKLFLYIQKKRMGLSHKVCKQKYNGGHDPRYIFV